MTASLIPESSFWPPPVHPPPQLPVPAHPEPSKGLLTLLPARVCTAPWPSVQAPGWKQDGSGQAAVEAVEDMMRAMSALEQVLSSGQETSSS